MATEPLRAAQADAALVRRWQRICMHVRCALSTRHADYVRLYLLIGQRVARRGLHPPGAAHLLMLRTLLQTAQDEALPWRWRSMCLQHVHLPLVQLRALIGLHDPIAMRAIEADVQTARDRLPPAPSRQA